MFFVEKKRDKEKKSQLGGVKVGDL